MPGVGKELTSRAQGVQVNFFGVVVSARPLPKRASATWIFAGFLSIAVRFEWIVLKIRAGGGKGLQFFFSHAWFSVVVEKGGLHCRHSGGWAHASPEMTYSFAVYLCHSFGR